MRKSIIAISVVMSLFSVASQAAPAGGWSVKNAQMNARAAATHYNAARDAHGMAMMSFGVNTKPGYQAAVKGMRDAANAYGAAMKNLAAVSQAAGTPPSPQPQSPKTPAQPAAQQTPPQPQAPAQQVPSISGTGYRNMVQAAQLAAMQKTPPAPTKQAPVQQTPAQPQVKAPSITGTTYRGYVTQLQAAAITAQTPTAPNVPSTINVNVGSLPGNTPVNVTINGVTVQTVASVVAAVTPTVQVTVPHIPAIISRSGNSGNHDHSHNRSAQSTDNNGQANAHASAFGGGRNADGAHFH